MSAWETELQDDRDASFGLGIDGGVRAMYLPSATPWLRPHVGLTYTTVLGYDAYARSSYDGLSITTGIEVGVD